jgi:DNA-binding MarR family transcriptional regulator
MVAGDDFFSVFKEWVILITHRSNRGHFHYARENGLSRSMLGTLFRLYHRKKVSVSGLSEHLGVSSAAASQMLERMVDEGLIQRVEDPADRRMKKITLTEAGERLVRGSIQAQIGWIKELEETFSEDEKSQITQAMQLMIDRLQKQSVDLDGEIGMRGEKECGDC